MKPELYRDNQKATAIYMDDPAAVKEAELRSCAGMCHSGELNELEGCENLTLEGGEYAVLLFKGPYPDLEHVYPWLYGTWLPQSGREPRDLPCYEYYLNNPDEVPSSELLTEIYLPLKKVQAN
jgi:AraC family transcriptional regulator